MCGVFEHYFTHLLDGYPSIVVVIVIGYVLIAIMYGIYKNWHHALMSFLVGYIVLVLYITVFSRPTNDHLRYSFLPFSTYYEIAKGDRFLLPQVVMNVVMFVPFGFILAAVCKSWDWKIIVIAGTAFSLLIELLQLIILKGSSELDDVIHNALGCLLGSGLYSASKIRYMFLGKITDSIKQKI